LLKRKGDWNRRTAETKGVKGVTVQLETEELGLREKGALRIVRNRVPVLRGVCALHPGKEDTYTIRWETEEELQETRNQGQWGGKADSCAIAKNAINIGGGKFRKAPAQTTDSISLSADGGGKSIEEKERRGASRGGN